MASIRERNGKFNVIYSYTNEKGERKQKWETYETKAEAKRRKKEIEYKKEMGSFVVRKCKTLDELITEYVALYGKENWALSTYEGNVSLINNYILPIIGDAKLSEINTRFIERYYQSLLKRRAVINPLNKTSRNEFVSSSTVRDINKLLRNCFEQAVKWELMEKNPCTHATVPKHKSQKRDIWTADTLMYALSVCEDERLKLAINLSFSCSLRLGELLGLTWDCVDISPEAIEENRAYVFINKESQRIRKESLNALDGKDVLLVFPTNHKKNSTVRILKTPKTESSVRKIFLPKSVANMLVDWKAEQDEMKEILGDEYMDYNLVMASTFGLPLGDGALLSGRPLVRFQSDAQMNSRNVDALEIGDTDGSPIEVRIPLIAPDDPNSPVMIPAITTHEMREGDNGLYNTFHRFLSDFIQEQCNLDRTRHLE